VTIKPALAPLLLASLLAACSTVQEPRPAVPAPVVAAETEPKWRPFPEDSFLDLLVAEFAVRRQQYDLALGNYLQQAFETRDPDVTERAVRLAQFLNADKAAVDAAQLWVELKPDDLDARFTLGTLLAKNQRPLEAMPHMVKVLDGGGDSNFAAIAASAADLPDATQRRLLAEFDALLKSHVDDPKLLTGKALLLQQLAEPDAALAVIRRALEKQPDELHAIVVEARLLQQLDRSDEALLRLEQVVQQYPYNRRLRLQYARLLTRTDMAAAREQFEVLLAQSPADADLILSLALVTKETGDREQSRQYFEQLLQLGQRTVEAHYYLGELAEEAGDWRRAVAHYEQIPSSPNYFPAISRAVGLQASHDDLAGARQLLATQRQRYPQHAVRLYLIEAELLLDAQQLEAGTRLLTEALALHPDQPNLLYARSMFSERRRDVALLEKDLRKILEQDPDNAVALNALGYTLANLTDRVDEAYALVHQALALKPDDPAILDSMGWVEYRRGNLRDAREYLERAYRDFRDDEVAAHLGEVLWKLGEYERALEVWREGLTERPDSPIVSEAVKRLTGKATP
jgi:tetratricopeptide (TPR) repeat protein